METADDRALFDAIIECIEQPTAVYSDKGRLMANRAFLQFMDVENLKDLAQTPLGSRIVPEDRGLVLQNYFPVATVRGQVLTKPRIPTKEGDVHVFEATGSRVAFSGEPALLLVLRDLTVRQISDARIRELQKTEVVGQIAASLAHEVNHPLSAIRTLAELLDQQENNGGKVRSIRAEADRAMELVQDFLKFARPAESRRQDIDLRAVLQSVLDILGYRFMAKQIRVDAKLGDEAILVHANRAQLQQIFFNVLTNAEQAIASHHTSGEVKISCVVGNSTVLMRITDDGPGIPVAHLEKIFEPFFTTKDESSGLGLTVSGRIVADHGGRMWAESECGYGASLGIELPLASYREEAAEKGA